MANTLAQQIAELRDTHHVAVSAPMPVRIVDHNAQAELYRFAFDQVCNKSDWKAPFTCWVPWSMANLYLQAIEFMTGVLPTCGGRVVLASGAEVTMLSCIGYRNGPCGG